MSHCAVPLKGKPRLVGAIGVGYVGLIASAREKDILNRRCPGSRGCREELAVRPTGRSISQAEQSPAGSHPNSLQPGSRPGAGLDSQSRSKLLAAEYSAIFSKIRDQRTATALQAWRTRRASLPHCPVGRYSLERVVRQCMECGKPAIAQCKSEHKIHEPLLDEGKADEYRAALAVPLLSQREVLGVLAFCYYERRRFDDSDISLAQDFAGQATVAIQNARLYQEAMENKLSLESAINQITNHGISLMDEKLDIIFANPAAYWLLGLNPERAP